MPPQAPYRTATATGAFLIALCSIVHVAGSGSSIAQTSLAQTSLAQTSQSAPSPGQPALRAAPKGTEVRTGTDKLPRAVLEMRDAILAAVRSGEIEDLRIPIEMNEIKPNFGDGPVPDPIAHLKQASSDGEGREVLAALANLLEAGYAVVPLGRDLENNRIYVWPYFAETGIQNLTPVQEVELYRLVPPAMVQAMRATGRYSYWRVAIAADGTWHVLSK